MKKKLPEAKPNANRYSNVNIYYPLYWARYLDKQLAGNPAWNKIRSFSR